MWLKYWYGKWWQEMAQQMKCLKTWVPISSTHIKSCCRAFCHTEREPIIWPWVGNWRGTSCKDTMETVGKHIVIMGLVCSPFGKVAGNRGEGLGPSPVPSSGSGSQPVPGSPLQPKDFIAPEQ